MKFTGAALGWVERELEMTDQEVGKALQVDPRTIARWRRREHAPTTEPRKRLRRLTQLKPLLENAFRTRAHGMRWLRQPVPALHGRAPISALIDGDIDDVLVILGTHACGTYV